MPIFEYQCKDCGHKFEKLILGEKEEIRCPKCDSKNVKKLLPSSIGVGRKGKEGGSCQSCQGTCPLCK